MVDPARTRIVVNRAAAAPTATMGAKRSEIRFSIRIPARAMTSSFRVTAEDLGLPKQRILHCYSSDSFEEGPVRCEASNMPLVARAQLNTTAPLQIFLDFSKP